MAAKLNEEFVWDRNTERTVRGWATRFRATRPLLEAEDLVQDAWVVFNKISRHYADDDSQLRDGLTRCSVNWKRFKTATIRAWMDGCSKERKARAAGVTFEAIATDEFERFHTIVPQSGMAGQNGLRAFELTHDLSKCPMIQRVLDRSSWEDGKRRIRRPRDVPKGRESVNDILYRLGGFTAQGLEIDGELSKIVDLPLV